MSKMYCFCRANSSDRSKQDLVSTLTMLLNWWNPVVLTAGWASGAGRLSRGSGWCGFGSISGPVEWSPDGPELRAPTHWSCCCSGTWTQHIVTLEISTNLKHVYMNSPVSTSLQLFYILLVYCNLVPPPYVFLNTLCFFGIDILNAGIFIFRLILTAAKTECPHRDH